MNSIIVLYSYHHNNTKKVANAISKVIGAVIKAPSEINLNEIQNYDLIGFGSGIDSGKHYKELLNFVSNLEPVEGKKCFIFSTSAIQGQKKVAKDHSTIRDSLESKGYIVMGEFSCKGYNTNSFLKFFGGMNKNHPNELDIEKANTFASEIIK